MRIRLIKQTAERHVLEVTRDDGSVSATELETRSLLRHDLMHYAVEQRAGLRSSLLGSIAAGAEPSTKMTAADPEIMVTEVLVGMLQGAAAKDADGDADAFVLQVREWLALLGLAMPEWFDAAFVRAVLHHYRQLFVQWQSLRRGGVLELQVRIP
jgi:hypothetical protein